MNVRKIVGGGKSIAGALLIMSPEIVETVKEIVVASGGDPVQVTRWAGVALLAVGLAHRIYKAVVAIEPDSAE